jgi:hypothetical protein
MEKNSPVSNRQIQLTDQPQGIYYLVVRTDHGIATKPLIKG